MRIPRSASPRWIARPEALREVRIVIVGVGAVAAQVDQGVPQAGPVQAREQLVLEGGPGVIGGEGDPHQL